MAGVTAQQAQQIAAKQAANSRTRDLKLYLGHPTQAPTLGVNAVGILSPIITFQPENNSFFALPRMIYPVIKLFKADGTQIDPGSTIAFAKQMPGEDVPVFAKGVVPYFSPHDLTTQQQRSRENAGPGSTMEFDLSEGMPFRESEQLIVYLKSPSVVDLNQAGTSFELTVRYRTY